MKRITYISKLVQAVTEDEIKAIGSYSNEKNSRLNITGVLIYVKGIFFQIIEGDEEIIDDLYRRITIDPRHKDVLCLKTENRINSRLFPEWSMKIINLDDEKDEIMLLLKILLENVSDSHSIILRYTQPAVINIFNRGINPLHVPMQKTDKVIIFADISSFSTLCENQPVEHIEQMLNYFFDACSRHIVRNGGEITKYIGDCVMSYFDSTAADNALQSCLDILAELEEKRNIVPDNSLLRSLYCGFGISLGTVMEGNIGSEIKKDFTIIGDAVNTASRLEGLTHQLNNPIILSGEVREACKRKWSFTSHGEKMLKGKTHNTEIFSLDHFLCKDFK